MRIEQLEYVAAVALYGSVRRAADHLHVSQPAVSEAIAKLEKELGVSLFERHRSGARLSKDGQGLLGHMTETLESIDRLKRAAGQQVAAPLVRVGTVSAGTSTVLAPAVRRLGSADPSVALEVQTLQADRIRVGLLEGVLDVGIVNQVSDTDVPPELESIPLLSGLPVAVVPPEHRLAQQSEVTLDELRAETFIRMRSGYVMHHYIDRLFDGDLPQRGHGSDGAEMGKLLVAQGAGITVLTNYSVIGDPLETAGLIRAVPITGRHATITLAVQRSRSARVSPAMNALVACLRVQSTRVQAGLDALHRTTQAS